MATLIDSYSESNFSNTSYALTGGAGGSGPKVGQAITGTNSKLSSAEFYIRKNGSPTGSAYAVLYAETHATAFGTDSKPTGGALATSDAFDVSTLTTTRGLKSFVFSGANKISLTAGTYYIITIEFSGGDASNYVSVGLDDTSPSHSGNRSSYRVVDSTWLTGTTYDVCFYLYGDSVVKKYIGVASASIKKAQGVAKASLKKINGVSL